MGSGKPSCASERVGSGGKPPRLKKTGLNLSGEIQPGPVCVYARRRSIVSPAPSARNTTPIRPSSGSWLAVLGSVFGAAAGAGDAAAGAGAGDGDVRAGAGADDAAG